MKASLSLWVVVCALVLSACSPVPVSPTARQPAATAVPTLAPTLTPVPPTLTPTPALTATPTLAPAFAGLHLHYPVAGGWVEAASETGARWTRLDPFFWDKIEPVKLEPAVYDWTQVDEASLAQISASGLDLIAVILYTPDWAQKHAGVACGPVADAEIERFALFLRTLVARYSQPPYNIHYWEIGNEPDVDYTMVAPRNVFGCWGDASDPFYGGGYYGQVLKVVIPEMKAADPGAQVLFGGLMIDCDPTRPVYDSRGQLKDCSQARFLEGALQEGAGAYVDGVSFHAYEYYEQALGQYSNSNWNTDWRTGGPSWIPKLAYVRSLLSAAGISEMPLYLTELATICGVDGKEDYCRTQEFEQTKAIYLAQTLAGARAEGIEAALWFGVDGWRGSGALRGGAPLPVYIALQFSEATLSGAEPVRPLKEYPGVQGFVFSKGGKEIWVLWSGDGQAHLIELPGFPGGIYTGTGQAMDPAANLEITVSPLYLLW